MAQGGIMTGLRWINFMRCIIDILKEAKCPFQFKYNNQTICTIGGEDITPHLFAVFESIDQIKDEYWREKICKAHGIPVESLFPTKEKIDKYNFIHDKKPKVYISGKISGLEEKEYKNNFNSAELYLTGLGYDVVNPVAYDTIPNGTWKDYMRRDLKLLLDCDYIYLLDNWTESTGAKVEYRLARDIGIEWLRLDESGKAV